MLSVLEMHYFQNLRKKIQITHLQRFKSSETVAMFTGDLVSLYACIYVHILHKYMYTYLRAAVVQYL
jgi:hypothetical protein